MQINKFKPGLAIFLFWLACVLARAQSTNGALTVQIGTGTTPAIALVGHDDIWRYRKGTNAPPVGWQTNADAALDSSWLSGPGGFGYGDNDDATVLADMPSNYTTVYIRKSFDVSSAVDTNRHLKLVMDFDDGFVAWLDGVEIARANAPGATGSQPAFNATATTGHEASGGDTTPNPPVTYDLGAVANRLQPGTHVLSLQGLNVATNSTDLSLIADLSVAGDSPSAGGVFFAILNTNVALLVGSNTIPNSVRVAVNGDNAAFDAAQGTWSKTQTLSPGFNRLTVQALDAAGVEIASTNQNIVVELAARFVGGALAGNTLWDSSMGIIHVTNTVVVPAAGSLSVAPGTVLLLGAGVSIQATNASITLGGTAGNAVYCLPADGTTVWGELLAVGTDGNLLLQHAETIAGHIEILEGATGTLEDSYLHDYTSGSPAIVHTLRPALLEMRRCHVAHYYEILSQSALNHIEDCLCEYQAPGGDGIDFDAARPGSYIRRCTIRHGLFTNVDGLDMGELSPTQPSNGVLIEDCLIYDFVDKGVSIGIATNVTVRNCVIYNVDSGVAVKDSSTATVYNNTIIDSNYGLHLYEKTAGFGGGHALAFNNIIWNVGTNIAADSLSTVTADHSDMSGAGIYPGTNNINADPLFLNPAGRDYRLMTNSPCIGSGRDGASMGALFPAGALPLAPANLVATLWKGTNVNLSWVDNSGNETGFEIHRSSDGTNWVSLVILASDTANFVDAAVQPGATYHYRIRAKNTPGDSDFSNEASLMIPVLPAIVQQPTSQTVDAGESVTFTVDATGTEPRFYQWRAGWVPGEIPGETNSTLNLTRLQPAIGRNHHAIVGNAAGSILSDIAVLTVLTNSPPAITRQPESRTVVLGADTTPSVTAIGLEPLAYQWFFNRDAMLDATNPTVTITNFSAISQGDYYVVVSSANASVTSDTAVLLLDSPLRLDSAALSTNGLFHLRLVGPGNTGYVIQATSDFATWTSLLTNSAPNGIQEFVDPASTNFPRRFYRLMAP